MGANIIEAKARNAAERRNVMHNRVIVALAVAFMVVAGWQVATTHVANSVTSDANIVSYTVRPGDTLWSYAQQITPKNKNVGDTVTKIMNLNQLDSDQLHPGQQIVVPEQS